MDFISIDEIYKKVNNKYLACVLISKRAKKYTLENYKFFIAKQEEAPDDMERKDPVKDAVQDFLDGKLDDRIKEYE